MNFEENLKEIFKYGFETKNKVTVRQIMGSFNGKLEKNGFQKLMSLIFVCSW